jgi:hypothetical protein
MENPQRKSILYGIRKKTVNVIGSLISFLQHYNEIFKRMPNGCNVTYPLEDGGKECLRIQTDTKALF